MRNLLLSILLLTGCNMKSYEEAVSDRTRRLGVHMERDSQYFLDMRTNTCFAVWGGWAGFVAAVPCTKEVLDEVYRKKGR